MVGRFSSLVNGVQYLTVSAFKTGALDPTFNETGSVMASNSGSSAAGVTVLSNGNVVAAGSTGSNFLLAQFTGAGGVDTAFAGGQVVNRPSLGSTDGFSSIAYQPFGNLLSAAGTAGSGFGQRMVVAQYNATTGAPNTAFGVGGAVSHPFREFASSLSAVAVDASGRTTGAGSAPVVNAVQGIGLMRVSSVRSDGREPCRSVQVHYASTPITVNFGVTMDEPLPSPVQARFCASPSAVVAGQGRVADWSLSQPASLGSSCR